jgi:molybdopterin-guanine dinucleotide biosynthesis protein A
MSKQILLNALILAGGKSSRMGQDKALMLFDRKPFLQQIDRIAQQCCDSVYILTPWPERYRDLIPDESNFLLESSQGEGSLFAFCQGLQQLEKTMDWLLLLACDLPLLEAEILLNWCENLPQISSDILAVVPKNCDRWEPLCGFYRPEILPHLEDFIDRGGRSFQKFLATVSTQAIVVSDREQKMLWNCNTPDDFKQISSQHFNASG